MSEQFLNNLRKLDQRPLEIPISVKIGSQTYQTFVSQKHTVQNIITRFHQNEFFSYKQPVAYLGPKKLQKTDTVGNLQKIKSGAEIQIQIRNEQCSIKKNQNQNCEQTHMITRSAAGQSMKSDPSTQYSIDKSCCLSYRQKSIDVNPVSTQVPQIDMRNQLMRIPSEQPYISITQFKELLQQSTMSQYSIRTDNQEFRTLMLENIAKCKDQPILNMLRKFNSPQIQQEIDYGALKNMSNFKQVKEQLEEIRCTLLTVMANQKFNKKALQRTKKITEKLHQVQQLRSQKKYFKTPYFQKTSSIDLLGSDQRKLMQEIQKIEASVNKLTNFNYENKFNQSQHKLQQMQDEVTRLRAQVKQASLPERLSQCSSILKQQIPFSISTLIMSKQNAEGLNNLKKHVMNYENIGQQSVQQRIIERLQIILTLRKTQIQWESIANYLDLIQFAKYDRILLLLQLDNSQKTIMAVYSTCGVASLKGPKRMEAQTTNQCKSGNGFMCDTSHDTKISSKTNEPILCYDDKFITIAGCLNIMMSHKKKMEIHYKEARKLQLKDSADQLEKLFANQKKIQVSSLELFRLYIDSNAENERYKLQQTTNSSFQSRSQAKRQAV